MSWRKIAYLDEVATLSDAVPADVKVQTASAGTGTAASRDDHKHNVTTGVPGSITENVLTPLEGTSVNLARSDHTHGTPADWTPKAHATSHKSGGGDSIKLNEFADPTGEIKINKQALRNPVIDPQATAPSTPVAGQVYFNTGDSHVYIYIP
jgi:hypothetical protein